jgi:hypothetical protein
MEDLQTGMPAARHWPDSGNEALTHCRIVVAT